MSARFVVTPAAADPDSKPSPSVALLLERQHAEERNQHQKDALDDTHVEDALYEEDISVHGHLSDILHKFASYGGGLQPKAAQSENESNTPSKQPQVKRARLGTMLGVFLPSLQNIFGVIMFLRLSWLVGTAGILEGFVIVFLCCSTSGDNVQHDSSSCDSCSSHNLCCRYAQLDCQ
ncbi:solute carrier family 12 member 5-like [Liolophura sinensis]|uniref:solute carrier family 12 member 5-like n=1 Tax=Liolophura sinensis TaxID=3198878 RepID=UPI0031592F8A